jgi:hypothetical protein
MEQRLRRLCWCLPPILRIQCRRRAEEQNKILSSTDGSDRVEEDGTVVKIR